MTKKAKRGLLLLMWASTCAALLWGARADGDTSRASTWRVSLATQFGSKTIGDPISRGVTFDKQAGTWFACLSKGRRGQRVRLNPLVMGIAHRTLPCHSVVEMCNPKNGLCVLGRVVDRGPFHAVKTLCAEKWGKHSQRCWEGGRTIPRVRLTDNAMYVFANDLDLLPRVAWAIRLNGKARIRWRVIHIPGRVLRGLAR